jgi:hypothetical protein
LEGLKRTQQFEMQVELVRRGSPQARPAMSMVEWMGTARLDSPKSDLHR